MIVCNTKRAHRSFLAAPFVLHTIPLPCRGLTVAAWAATTVLAPALGA